MPDALGNSVAAAAVLGNSATVATALGSLPAICVAMPEELAPFLGAAQRDGEERELGGARFIPVLINQRPALLVANGIGLVNAAVAATLAVSQFGATCLISSGSAGGVGKNVQVGDIVVGTETLFSTADATAFGEYTLGQIPRMPARFQADPALAAAATRRSSRVEDPYRDHGTPNVHIGLTLSGDAFIWVKNYQDYVAKFPDALATDMETAAIAQVAHKFDIPWVSIRAISDLCGPQAAGDFNTHIDDAASLAAAAVLPLLANLA